MVMLCLVFLCFIATCLAAPPEVLEKRIVNSENADMFEHPHQTSLQLKSGNIWEHICGAVLIGPHKLVTAAHCLEGETASKLRVVVGALKLYEASNPYQQTLRVSRFTIHPNYDGNAAGSPNDIAVIFLNANVVYNANVQPAALAPKGSCFADTECVITGWGLTVGGGSPARHLQEAHITKITNTLCRSYYGPRYINDRHICVFERSASSRTRPGACSGDSGGPMMCGPNKSLLAGISSYGYRLCSTDYPSVYTRVSEFVDWINDTN